MCKPRLNEKYIIIINYLLEIEASVALVLQ